MPDFRASDGRKLTYRRLGSGPPLVCHPGGPGGSSAFFEDLGGLDRDLELLLLNPRGAGGSDPPADPSSYRLEEYAADLDEFRARLGFGAIDLLGHSAGGFVAVAYADRFPGRVRRLILCSTTVRFWDEWRQDFRDGLERRSDDPRLADAVAARLRRGADRLTDEEIAESLPRELPLLFARFGEREREFVERFRSSDEPFHVPALNYFNEHVAPTYDQRPALRRIEAPTLVLVGELDYGMRVAAAEIGDLVRDAHVVRLPGVGHMPWVEAPDQFRREVLGFLAR